MEESVQSIWESDNELPDCFDDPPPLSAPPALPLLEDGEIAHTSGFAQPDFTFCFAANDVDAAIKSAKKHKNEKKAKQKKKQKHRRAHRSNDPLDLPRRTFIVRTCRFLKEPKEYLVKAAVERLGRDVVCDLVHEVQTIEANGGQMTVDGKRRRTPGGVLWNVVKSRYEDDFKAIMAAGREIEKQSKRKAEPDGMAIEGQPAGKRRRTGAAGTFIAPAAQVKRTGVTVWPSRHKDIEDIQCKVDPDNARALTRVQNAWAVSVKQNVNYRPGLNDVEMYDDGAKKKPTPLADRLRVPIHYDDLVGT